MPRKPMSEMPGNTFRPPMMGFDDPLGERPGNPNRPMRPRPEPAEAAPPMPGSPRHAEIARQQAIMKRLGQ